MKRVEDEKGEEEEEDTGEKFQRIFAFARTPQSGLGPV